MRMSEPMFGRADEVGADGQRRARAERAGELPHRRHWLPLGAGDHAGVEFEAGYRLQQLAAGDVDWNVRSRNPRRFNCAGVPGDDGFHRVIAGQKPSHHQFTFGDETVAFARNSRSFRF